MSLFTPSIRNNSLIPVDNNLCLCQKFIQNSDAIESTNVKSNNNKLKYIPTNWNGIKII